MKQVLRILFAFSVAVASCQCAFAGDNRGMQPELEQDCHEAELVVASPQDCDCCDEEATANKPDSKVGITDLAPEQFVASLPDTAMVHLSQNKRPPPSSTPISRGDRLLT